VKKEGHALFCAKLFWEWLVIGFLFQAASVLYAMRAVIVCQIFIFLHRQASFSYWLTIAEMGL